MIEMRDLGMKAWRLDRIIGAVEHLRRNDRQNRFGREYCLSFAALGEEIGIDRNALFRIYRNERSSANLDVLEMILSWATDVLGRKIKLEDLLELTPEPWAGPVDLKTWNESYPQTLHDATTGGRETQKEVSDRRIEAAVQYFGLK